MKSTKFYSIISLLIIFASEISTRRHRNFRLSDETRVRDYWFTNIVDHFSHKKSGTYEQRFWYVDTYFDPSKYHIFIYLCGEGKGGFPNTRNWPIVLAMENNAMFFSIEHRYYGQSQPMEDWSTENLKFLTHEQALADVAYFIESKNEWIRHNYPVTGIKPKWIVVGGSYAGALSAWFRLKYPHLVVGSIASSGVVNAFEDFQQYEWQVKQDLGKSEGCLESVISLQQYANTIFKGSESDISAFKTIFNATELNEGQFMDFYADHYTGAVQYSSRRKFCQSLKTITSQSEHVVDWLSGYAKIGEEYGVKAADYLLTLILNTKIDEDLSERQWTYQYCTAFGWFQIAEKSEPLKWPGINLQSELDFCKQVFGLDLVPDSDHTNDMFGGLAIGKVGSNIAFSQGGDDPWQWAGLRENIYDNHNIYVHVADCSDCGHCGDLHMEKEDDPPELQITRNKERELVIKWFNSKE